VYANSEGCKPSEATKLVFVKPSRVISVIFTKVTPFCSQWFFANSLYLSIPDDMDALPLPKGVNQSSSTKQKH
jgi:hypothetical protein